MVQLSGGKTGKYDKPEIFGRDSSDVEYQRYILNLDEKLIIAIEDFIHEQKKKGETMFDIKTGRHKKINRSLWARKVFVDALKNLGVEIE